jgi:superfamily I DNA and/or RNA helicase
MEMMAQIAHWRKLLKIEREEDLRQYRETVLKRTLKQRVADNISWYPVALKRLSIGLGEQIVLEMERTVAESGKPGAFQPGGMVAVFGMEGDKEAGRATGVVASLRQGVIKIALGTEHIPDWLYHSQLGIDLEFDDKTYKEMEAALRHVEDPGKNERLKELRSILIGNREPEFHKWDYRYTHPTLNASQQDAVQRVLEALDIAIIHGPPGTGKTTTLVQAIKEVLYREHQVLVCAPSNTAVDLLTLKCEAEGLSVIRLGNPVRVEESLQKHTLDGAMMEHPDYQALRKLRQDAEKIKLQAMKFKRNFGYAERQRRQEMLKEAGELTGLAHKLEDYILHQLINRTQVIACTLTGANANVLGRKRFSTVFIDEAAQALAPACWIPILRSDRVIMAGDHCQLPPTVKSMEADRGGLGVTLFEQVIERLPQTSVMLSRQYRMHEDIMQFSGRRFYADKLEAAPEVRFHTLGPDFPPLEFIDTAGCGFEEVKNEDTLSLSNPEEAALLLRRLAHLFNQISDEVPGLLEQNLSIGIISPYKDQVRTLREQVQNSPMLSGFSRHLTIHTVDGFQGQERDVMLISLVRSNNRNEIGFLQDIRRMNVALTRAKKKLIVTGDSATLGNHSFYGAFLDYVEEKGAYHTAWEWMET